MVIWPGGRTPLSALVRAISITTLPNWMPEIDAPW
jgi:hypothetical protein